MLRSFILINILSFTFAIGPYGYHNRFGISKAKHIWKSEWFGALRIVGGSQVTAATLIPYQAGIIVTLPKSDTSICGGAVLSNTRIITAAHCWWDGESQATTFTAVLGSLTIFSGGTRIATKDVVTHSSWNPQNIINDIAIVKIPAVVFNNNIQAVSLPTNAQQDFAGMTATASGYGKRSDSQASFPSSTSLYTVSLSIITNNLCQSSFSLRIQDNHICTSGQGGKGTCDGDSGGPLTVITNNLKTLVGIVSFGLGDGCQLSYPSVFTRVTSYLTWIKSNM